MPAGGNRAYGWLPDKRTKDETEAALLVAGVDDILEGVGLHAICRRWNLSCAAVGLTMLEGAHGLPGSSAGWKGWRD
ncbi:MULTISPECIES: hypothetical protein [unclassified Frankia]|uniref:hypothetical protein n=1 Tax=unclassified Frankia TaxID=2632575 RepID=UPI002AD5224E|nr:MULTISPECIES: hypothetical protein [unclassified Frankia]